MSAVLLTSSSPNIVLGTLGSSLTTGKILIGDAFGVAAEQNVSGDATLALNGALTLATVNADVGAFTTASITVNEKGLITAAASGTPAPVVVMDNTAAGNDFPEAPQTTGIWYGTGTKAGCFGIASHIAIGNSAVCATAKTNATAIGQSAAALGSFSTAIGYSARVETDYAIAIGDAYVWYQPYGIAVGNGALTTVPSGIAIGKSSSAIGVYDKTAVGNTATADGNGGPATAIGSLSVAGSGNLANCVAVGHGARSDWYYTTAVGDYADSGGERSVALGFQANSSGYFSTSLGSGSTASNNRAVAVGKSATASAVSGIAIGTSAVANSLNCIAIGDTASTATYTGVICIGYGAVATANDTLVLSIGSVAAAPGAATAGLRVRINGVNYTIALS